MQFLQSALFGIRSWFVFRQLIFVDSSPIANFIRLYVMGSCRCGNFSAALRFFENLNFLPIGEEPRRHSCCCMQKLYIFTITTRNVLCECIYAALFSCTQSTTIHMIRGPRPRPYTVQAYIG